MKIYGTGLLNGLRISLRNMLRPTITVQYPKQKLELPERSRWAVAPKYDAEGNPKCTACMICVNTCPDFVLAIDFTTDPETKDKHIVRSSYQVGACMMCGLCVESCPFDALEMSHNYELARVDAAELEYDLLRDVDAAKPKREPKPAPVKPQSEKDAPAPDAEAAVAAGEAAEPSEDPATDVPPEKEGSVDA